MMQTVFCWIRAMRLRSLPLSLSGVVLGGAFASFDHVFSWKIFVLSLVVGVLLQILTNFANDYGDATKGLEGALRQGPKGVVSSGVISPKKMLRAIFFVVALIVLFSLFLFYVSFGNNIWAWSIFSVLLLVSIWAAMSYTMGKNPYGYRAQGDFYVFIFFGLVAVAGSYCLYGGSFYHLPGFPACAAGLLSCAVLNVNNIRDMKSDAVYGKESLALRLGDEYARYYHVLLVLSAFLCWLVYFWVMLPNTYLLLLILYLPLAYSAYKVYTSRETLVLDRQVDITAASTGIFHIIVSIMLFMK